MTDISISGISNYGALLYGGLDSAIRWNADKPMGSSVTITYCFSEVAPSYQYLSNETSTTPFRTMDELLRPIARSIFDNISELTNISFVEIFGNNPKQADIAINGKVGGGSYAFLPGNSPSSGDIAFDIGGYADGLDYGGILSDVSLFGKYMSFIRAFTHELGHALGLSHPRNYPTVDGVLAPNSNDYSVAINPALDSQLYSTMSYLPPPSVPSVVEWLPLTPMYLDILALQHLYGTNLVSTAGNDSYILSAVNPGYQTIWDNGGHDTLDFSNQQSRAVIDLRDGHTSSFGVLVKQSIYQEPYVDNLVIGPNTVIEDVIGSSFSDSIVGNNVNNSLSGGGGDDILNGGAGDDSLNGGRGTDVAVYRGKASEYLINYDPTTPVFTVKDGVANRDGNDTLSSVEILQFSDHELYPAGVFIPIISLSPTSQSIVEGDAGSQLMNFTVTLSGVSSDVVTVEYTTISVTAGAGSESPISNILAGIADFAVTRGTLTFASGETAKTISVAIFGDKVFESDETLTLALRSPTGGVLGAAASATATILNNDTSTISLTLMGTSGNDTFNGGAGNDTIDGGAGIDTAVYAGARTKYTVIGTADRSTVVDKTSAEGTDTLTSIERLKFSDFSVALDAAGYAGTTAKILGAVFGKASVANKEYAGIGLQLLDGGMDYAALMQLALNAALGAGASNAAVVNLLYTNVVGTPPPAAELVFYQGMLDSGAHSQASLGMLAADTVLNTVNVNLVGLAVSGLEYLPLG